MIIAANTITDLCIKTVKDLYKLKPFMEDSKLKIIKSQIARELEIDRRTVDKYMNGFQKSITRNSTNCLSAYYDTISELLSDRNQQMFYYRRVLWQYLLDNYSYQGSYVNFCYYLKKYPELDTYFRRNKSSNKKLTLRYETPMGKQAQLDWKESIDFTLSTGEVFNINIFVLLLSYSRFRIYRLSLSKSQVILFSFLDSAFDTFGGVPSEIVTDNMKTVMDTSRTEYQSGKVNYKFKQFADDYGFEVKPCIAGRPQTKAKVEAPMKVLDEIRAYNGTLTYNELHELISRINHRVNCQVNQGTGRIPMMFFQKERTFLHRIPPDTIRKPYQLITHTVKVNHASMFHYKNCQYSVPPEYVGKHVKLQVHDEYIHVYYNTDLITIHSQSKNKLNYHHGHYAAIARKTNVFQEEKIQDIATNNLKTIGEMYHYE